MLGLGSDFCFMTIAVYQLHQLPPDDFLTRHLGGFFCYTFASCVKLMSKTSSQNHRNSSFPCTCCLVTAAIEVTILFSSARCIPREWIFNTNWMQLQL